MSFVLTEYFGYLRRNPNDAPEPNLNYEGYDFWLTKLNAESGDTTLFNTIDQTVVASLNRFFDFLPHCGRGGFSRSIMIGIGQWCENGHFSCNAPYNQGGLGKVLAHLVEAARSAGELGCYYASRKKPNDPQGQEISLGRFRWWFHAPPLRYSHNWRDFLSADLFDRAVAQRLRPAETFHGFSGRAQHSFVRVRQLNYKHLALESPTSHVAHVRRQHLRAIQAFPIEKSWLNGMQYKKSLLEYETADLIYVISEYSRRTYLEAGVPESKLRRRTVTIESRFASPTRDLHSGGFTIAYVGRLHVSKGLPVLLEAFARLQDKDAELILVGGYGTDGMEKYLRGKLAADRRILNLSFKRSKKS